MSTAIKDLSTEHDAMQFTLAVLTEMISLVRKGEDIPEKDLRDITGFFQEFGDTCHHGKEETILFPAIDVKQIFQADNLIANLRAEHDLGRNLLHRMADSLEKPVNIERFFTSAQEYITLMKEHIRKEETLLFPLTEANLPQSVLADLHDRFEEFEQTVIGSGRHEELHAMLDVFKSTYMR